LQGPNISSPSICAILIMQSEPKEHFRICVQVVSNLHIGLFYARAIHFYQTLDLVNHLLEMKI
jgi:hypothetical protein